MNIKDLFSVLKDRKISINVVDGKLKIRAPRGAIDKDLDKLLKENRKELLSELQNRSKKNTETKEKNNQTIKITPELLTMVNLDQIQIDNLVKQVPGGAVNVQDIYPLGPLQEGLLFHHILQKKGDAYLTVASLAFDSEKGLKSFVNALDKVISRHDIFRTAVLWQDLDEPVQVVWRSAPFELEILELAADSDIAEELSAYTDPLHIRLDVQKAPMLKGVAAYDQKNERWQLQFLYHHLIMDHTSLELLLEEVMLIQQQRESELVTPVPFRNFVAQARMGISQQEHDAFFSKMLHDVDEPTAPFGLLNIQNDGSGIVEAQLAVERSLALRIRQQVKQQNVSTASLFHLAWALVLAKTSGREDVVFGTVLFGRFKGGAGAERAMGMFINTLPLRINMLDCTVEHCLKSTYQALTNLLKHEHASLSRAQQCSAVQAPTPLFSAFLNYRYNIDLSSSDYVCEGMTVLGDEDKTNYPFDLSVDDFGDGFNLTAQVDRIVCAQRICEFMHVALENVVSALEKNDDVLMHNIGVIPEKERCQLLSTFNQNKKDYVKTNLIHQLFEQQVTQTPEHCVLRFEAQRISYRELNEKANQLAHYLIDLGIKPDDRVALCLNRSSDMVIAVLAILKAGGAYVPMDPDYPSDRLAYMLANSEPVVLLTETALLQRLVLADTCKTLIIDQSPWLKSAWGQLSTDNVNAQSIGLNNKHLAYVIFTSGSTGNPKGVMVEHASVTNLILAQSHVLKIDEHSRVLQFASVSFDAFVWELVSVLSKGAQLCIPRSTAQLTGQPLAEFVAEHKITHATIPPVVLAQMPVDSTLATIKVLVTAGEASSKRLVQRWAKNRILLNAYGPTETSVCATIYECSLQDTNGPSIGFPIANTQIYILDEHLGSTPLGVTGEIYIGGDSLARGYLNNINLTDERFLVDPFANNVNRRIYKTGDLGYWQADGSIAYAGRNDFQIKIRGYRIELGEIEAQLSKIAGVHECAVIAREDTPGNKRLVAYIVVDGLTELDPIILRENLTASLPEYMVPVAYVAMQSLPLTVNGKLDKKILPMPEDDAYVQQTYQAPVGPIEEALANIWSKLLNVEKVGRLDNFFELGGHSLLAVQLISQVRQRLSLELPLSLIFSAPSLIGLAQAAVNSQAITLVGISLADRNSPLALSYAQQRLWFIDQMDKQASVAYHIPGGLRLSGKLNQSALVKALDCIVKRHEVLRVRFATLDGKTQQLIAPFQRFTLTYRDVQTVSHEEYQGICEEEALREFDLEHDALIRGQLLTVSNDEHVLLLTMHHIISDGWSIGILKQEISALYNAFNQGLANPLTPLAIQYVDFAQWQQQSLQETFLCQQEYWLEQLADAPELVNLPTDHIRPEIQNCIGANLAVTLDRELTKKLKVFSQQQGTTLYMTILAAWSALVSRLSGQDQVVIGSPNANRNRAELEPLIGFFVNSQAMKVDFTAQPNVSELLHQVKNIALAAQDHQDIPFEQVVEALNPSRSMAYNPIFQLMFTWENNPTGELSFDDLCIEDIDLDHYMTQFDLSLDLQEEDGEIVGGLNYAVSLFEEKTIQQHWRYLRTLLVAMVENPLQDLSQVPLLSQHELSQQLTSFNGPVVNYQGASSIHGRFEAQVTKTPLAIAAVFKVLDVYHRLSYEQLNQRSNQVAAYLRLQGIGANTIVGLYCQRSLDFLVGVLGILKAGGAYVPLDPSNPKERLNYMVSDSQVSLILSQEVLRDTLTLPDTCYCVYLDNSALFSEYSAENVANESLPEDLAYMIYTSGSTGQPKGALVHHGGA
ncbi:MAG: amino acid adenylation domain-containing protein, partial [Alteromonadaceae bacterium]